MLSSGAPGDPVAIANASFQVSADRAADHPEPRSAVPVRASASAPAPAAALPGGRVRGPQAIEYVIRRGGSQMGVPYSWGGGALNGPSAGVDYDAGKIGYDCSGFTRYAFAGVGVQIPKYSGRPVQHRPQGAAVAGQARRPLFWGPGGSQHVAIYLGGGKMLEASGSAGQGHRQPGADRGHVSRYLARIIES